MRVGAFELDEPVPELRDPHVLAMLDPWIDVGGAGTLALTWLEKHFQAEDIGRISRPGHFFDFTRYRPTIYYDEEGKRQIAVPNTYLTYGRGAGEHDFLFLHLLEPHSHSDLYIDSIIRVLTRLGVKRYCLLGSMYDYIPHTLPLPVTGSASGDEAAMEFKRLGIEGNKYEGPTTITTLISQRAPDLGIETMSIIVHLPQYTQLDEDYTGAARLMDTVSSLYEIPVDNEYYEKARQQMEEIDQALNKNPQLKAIVKEMESQYGSQSLKKPGEKQTPLSPEIESFLSEMERRFKDGPE
jgi:predicted ATP-grasp superfamily ATP-dependent carboligase